MNRNPLYSLFNSLHLTKYKESISDSYLILYTIISAQGALALIIAGLAPNGAISGHFRNWHKVACGSLESMGFYRSRKVLLMNAIRSVSGSMNRYEIKNFKSQDSLYKFMATGDNSLRWSTTQWNVGELNLPSGQYRTQMDSKSIRYINVKTDKVYSFAR